MALFRRVIDWSEPNQTCPRVPRVWSRPCLSLIPVPMPTAQKGLPSLKPLCYVLSRTFREAQVESIPPRLQTQALSSWSFPPGLVPKLAIDPVPLARTRTLPQPESNVPLHSFLLIFKMLEENVLI